MERVEEIGIKCKGLYFKANVSNFLSQYKSIESRVSLRFMVKRSCPGCDECGWVWEHDSLKEDIKEHNDRSRTLFVPEGVIDEKIYKLHAKTKFNYEHACFELQRLLLVQCEG